MRSCPPTTRNYRPQKWCCRESPGEKKEKQRMWSFLFFRGGWMDTSWLRLSLFVRNSFPFLKNRQKLGVFFVDTPKKWIVCSWHMLFGRRICCLCGGWSWFGKGGNVIAVWSLGKRIGCSPLECISRWIGSNGFDPFCWWLVRPTVYTLMWIAYMCVFLYTDMYIYRLHMFNLQDCIYSCVFMYI